MTRLRVKLYSPSVAASTAPHFSVRAARFLGDYCDRAPGLEFSVTAAADDESGSSLSWPAARVTPLSAEELQEDPFGLDAFARLTSADSRPFDVLFLSQPWKFYPTGRLTPTAVPFVAYVQDLGFDDVDLGPVTDERRFVMATLARECAAVVFPSAATRDRAVRRYGIPVERAFVVAPARSIDIRPAGLAQPSGIPDLPPEFVLLLEDGRPTVARELRQALLAKGLSLPVVVFDRPAGESDFRPNEEGSAAGVVRLGRLAESDYRTVLARATTVVAETISPKPFFDTPHFDALASRRPLFCRVGTESDRWAGDADGAATLYRSIDEVAGRLRRLRDDPQAFADQIDRGEALAQSRSEADVARELFDIFRRVHQAPRSNRVRFRTAPQAARETRILCLVDEDVAAGPPEIPLLRSLGYEVYAPPRIRRGRTAFGGTDDQSTLPRWVLERLGRHDFHRTPLTSDLVELLNGYFGTAIVPVQGTAFIDVIDKFRGRIVARAPGREHPAGHLPAWNVAGESLLNRIRSVLDRFWLATPHDAVKSWEPDFIRGRILTLPLGISERARRRDGRWTGTRSELLFLGLSQGREPQTHDLASREFKYHFGDLPHVIASGTDASRLMNEMRVLYDPERDWTRLREFPLHAIVLGLPVVYLTGGPLDVLGGPTQPGACENEADARRTVRRLLDGDRDLIDAIRAKQGEILRSFTDEAVRKAWNENFVGRVMASPTTRDGAATSPRDEAPPRQRATSLPSKRRNAPRIGICIGGSSNPEAVRQATILAEAFATSEPANRVSLRLDRRAIEGSLTIKKRPNLKVCRLTGHLGRFELPTVPLRLFWRGEKRRRSRTAPLTFERIRRIATRNDVTVFIDPVDGLAIDQPIEAVHELPVVMVVGDLVHEFSPIEGDRSLARHREMRLWSKIARHFVFGSEHVRREAIRLYGIAEDQTTVIPTPPFVERRDPPPAEETFAVRRRLGLPAEYVLTPASIEPNVNTLAALEAISVLKWRRGKTPMLVLAGRDARRLFREESGDPYAMKIRDVIRDGRLVEGTDFVVVDQIAPREIAGLYAGARAYIAATRFEAQVHGTVYQAMLAKCPVVCSDIAVNVEQLGMDGEHALLVPTDDPAAFADAVSSVIEDADETSRRTNRAHALATRFDGRAALDVYRRVITAAAGRESTEDLTTGEPLRSAA